MTGKKRTIEEEILNVLQEENGPLHYREISHRIMKRGLANLGGATPQDTVSGCLSRRLLPSKKVNRISPGFYEIYGTTHLVLPNKMITIEEEQRLTRVSAYGLFWERSKVFWASGARGRRKHPRLPGSPDDSEIKIDFADQSGVYILYGGTTPVYVGRAIENSLFQRLSEHHTSDRRGSRWNQFSWFGFRSVNEDGTLSADEATFTTGMLITILESVMIEGFTPALNDKGGEWLGTEYRQIEAPELREQQEEEFRKMVSRAMLRS